MAKLNPGVNLCLFVLAVATPAAAQQPTECGCTAPLGSEGLVRAALGKVLVSRETGFAPARADARFKLPARVLAGPRSSSTIDIGADCSVSIAENQSIEIDSSSGKWCARVVEGRAIAGSATSAADRFSSFAAAGVGGAAAGALAISIAREDDRVSR